MKVNFMKDVFDVINGRRSVRSYKKEQLKDEEIEKIINAGLMAPTARGEEPWHFTVIQDQKLLKEMNDIGIKNMASSGDKFLESIANSGKNILHNAPTVIIISGNESASDIKADCSAAIENILLAAEGLDIGSCWIGLIKAYFQDPESSTKLKIPNGYVPLYGVTLGYKNAEKQGNPNRNENVVNWIR
ncbi:MAG: nitroreductase family protein [Methanobrevibacter arboriphilus]|jgi:nitroreductase|uniref:Nitroreductase family protein n=2 Tax=Methanobrevibacter arboriphilus TaxID=39441 RepID=A0A843AMX5_METAZ|nr:nitroreductase family protein [Methanobrevibacter arboriphilus]